MRTRQFLAIDRAQNLSDLRAAHQTYQGLPWMYTLATDTGGTAFFADMSVVPHLTDQQAVGCVLQTDPERSDILDGSTAACDWGRDSDAAEPGIFAPSQAPTLTRADYVANSNNSPLLANPAEPLTGYPAVYDTRTQPELRPRMSLTMIAERVGGTDGLGAAGFSLPTLQAAMLGDRVESADLGRSDVVNNAIDPSPDNTAQGSSFIMAVEMTTHGPVARTILTYSESANPTSPHYADQTTLFSHKQWVTERFTEAQIDADPTLQVTVLYG